MIKKILGFLNIFLSLKIKFFKPEKADILLYDQGIRFNYLFQKSFEDIKFQIFYKRLEDDIDITFYNIKNFLKEDIKTISIQRCARESKEFKNFNNYKKKLIADYVLLFSMNQKKFYRKYIKAKYLEIGSFQNNFYKKKNKTNKKLILLISQFLEQFKLSKQFEHEKKIVQFLKMYCKKNKYNFKILIKNLSGYDFLKDEINRSPSIYLKYFQFLNKNNLILNQGMKTNYYFLDDSKLVIFIDSSLGEEAASRKNKVLRIPFLKKFNKESKSYEVFFLKDFNSFEKKINQTISGDKKIYLNNLKSNGLIKFNEDNKILKNLVYKILNK